jgi:hypothetical protein
MQHPKMVEMLFGHFLFLFPFGWILRPLPSVTLPLSSRRFPYLTAGRCPDYFLCAWRGGLPMAMRYRVSEHWANYLMGAVPVYHQLTNCRIKTLVRQGFREDISVLF